MNTPVDRSYREKMRDSYSFSSNRSSSRAEAESQRLQALFDCLHEGVIRLDSEGRILQMNTRAERIFRQNRQDFLRKSLLNLFPNRLQERIHLILQELRINHNETSITLTRKINRRWVQLHFSAIWENEQPKEIILNLVDETEKRCLQEKQRSLEFELLQEHKLSSIGILASGIAHNLNGPLTIMVGYLDLLYSRLSEANEIPLILAQAEKMKDIISNMMIKSRREQDNCSCWLNLNSLLKNELKFLEANLHFKHQVDKQFEFAVGLPEITGVYSDFSQSFHNIISNALDAMVDSPVKNLHIKTSYDRENIFVEFHDTGHGLQPEEVEKIFDPFYSTKPPVGEGKPGRPTGTGLGLPSASQLVEKYGGRIEVDGRPGRGACFKVIIPIDRNRPLEKAAEVDKASELEVCSEMER